jgi:hypothetical protein
MLDSSEGKGYEALSIGNGQTITRSSDFVCTYWEFASSTPFQLVTRARL